MSATAASEPAAGRAAAAHGERDDLLGALANARHFLRFTVRGLSDEQARRRTTVSELCLAEIAHHAGHADIVREALDGATSMG